ncbi:MAG TPA: ankyrin repeat domain-containing protein, partial [Candidatus Binatia bacterium]|nr:ankyrin repeat domain-containing protein [Candidatus Binatia bacterium]
MKPQEAKKDDTFDPELIKPIEKGDLKAVRARLAAGANVNVAPKREVLPIFVAIGRGHLNIVEALIAAGA